MATKRKKASKAPKQSWSTLTTDQKLQEVLIMRAALEGGDYLRPPQLKRFLTESEEKAYKDRCDALKAVAKTAGKGAAKLYKSYGEARANLMAAVTAYISSVEQLMKDEATKDSAGQLGAATKILTDLRVPELDTQERTSRDEQRDLIDKLYRSLMSEALEAESKRLIKR